MKIEIRELNKRIILMFHNNGLVFSLDIDPNEAILLGNNLISAGEMAMYGTDLSQNSGLEAYR